MKTIDTLDGKTTITGHNDDLGISYTADLVLAILKIGWLNGEIGEKYEELADGFGAGAGTLGDWSGIRDSSEDAKMKMLEVTLNHFETLGGLSAWQGPPHPYDMGG